MTEPTVAVVILTYNEERHIERCIESVVPFADEIHVVDSFSEDRTIELARERGAAVVEHEFQNQAQQFNWALDNLQIDSDWILRLDADEYADRTFRTEVLDFLSTVDADVDGVYVRRQIHFLGKWIEHGGVYPQWVLRLFRNGRGHMEPRWMDEHLVVEGEEARFDADIIDDNKRPLGWWIDKHNRYSTREAIELLDKEYGILQRHTDDENAVESDVLGDQVERRRYLKNAYNRAPKFFRAFIYFVIRYFVRGGFLDGTRGLIWHFLQAGWYRFLVDAKVDEIKRAAGDDPESIRQFIRDEYGHDV